MVGHRVFNWILNIREVLSDRLVISFLWQVTDSKWPIFGCIHHVFALEWELAVAAKGLAVWVEAAVLEDTGCIRLSLVEDECCSSLIIKLPHILLPFKRILSISKALLKWLISRPRHKVYRRVLWTWVVVGELFQMHELGVFDEFVATIRLETIG